MAILDKIRQIESIQTDWPIAVSGMVDLLRMLGQTAAADYLEMVLKNEIIKKTLQIVVDFVWDRYFSGKSVAFSSEVMKTMSLAEYAKWIPVVMEIIRLWKSLR